MQNCAIIGATGYTGMELIRILSRHPRVRLTELTTRQKRPIPVRRLISDLPKRVKLSIRPYDFSTVRDNADIVFLCLPHKEAAETAAKFYQAGKIVIDLSADFRLSSWQVYEQWYDIKHTQKTLLKKAVYGLPEMFRNKIRRANLIANPGCYPTSAILGALPLLKRGLVEPHSIVVDSKSGVSGAGKHARDAIAFYEEGENFKAYKVGSHRHTPEIEQALTVAAGKKVAINFTPHLLPVHRGLLSTTYLKKKKRVTAAKISKAFKQAFAKEPFVRVLGEGVYPSLKEVQNTNFCDVGFFVDSRTDRVIVITAIDNLVKGASGQAVQNMNIRLGFSEKAGLV